MLVSKWKLAIVIVIIKGGEMKRVTVELGGKSPLILFDDCDVDDAVNAILIANFYSNGEVWKKKERRKKEN